MAVTSQSDDKNTREAIHYETRILQALRKIMHSVDIHSRKLSSLYDITTPQLLTLLAIAEHGPLTIAAISRQVHLRASTLVGIIDRLENKHYITRQRSTTDRRQVLISISEPGKEFIKRAPSPLQETLANALKQLPLLEQTAILLSLERLVELMAAKDVDAPPILQTGEIEQKNNA